jgi:hypothetical protein
MAIYLSLKLKVITTSHELGNINMLKKSVLVFALLTSITPFSSMASLITTTQTQEFSGTAGNDSDGSSVDHFMFEKFDNLLGTLDNVFIRYSLFIDSGFIGADNLTNVAVNGTGVLGAEVDVDSTDVNLLGPTFQPLFDTLEATQSAVFNLAADPSQSAGVGGGTGSTFIDGNPNTGNSDDRSIFNGGSIDTTSGFLNVSDFVFDGFIGNSGDTFEVTFNSTSIVTVDAAGTQGTFEAVDAIISMDLYYEYTAAVVPPVVGVPEPAVFAFGLLMLCAVTGRKFIK